MKSIPCLPEVLTRQKLIDYDAHEAPQFLLDLNTLVDGERITLASLSRPEFWKHQSKFLSKHARVRVLGFNRAFDLMFTVADVDGEKGFARLEECSLGLLPSEAMMSARKAQLAAVHVAAAKARETGPKWIPRIVGGTAMKIQTLPATDLKLDVGGMHSRKWWAVVDDKIEFADLFASTFWHHFQSTLLPNDVIRVRRRDGAFDCELTVAGKAENGAVRVEPWPLYPNDKAAAEQAGTQSAGTIDLPLQMVPVHTDGEPRARVQYLPATKWRVLGWDGSEVSRDHETEAKAREVLTKYVADLRMRMPTPEELAAARAEIESKKKGRAS